MRIGLITGEYPPMKGGIGAYARILAQHFIQQNHEVYVFTNQAGNQKSPHVHLTASASHWNINTMRQIQQWSNGLDMVNLQYQTAAYGMSPFIHFLPDMLSVPFVTTFHDLRVPYLFPKAGKLRDWIVRHMATASDGVIATNQEDAQQLAFHTHNTLIPIGSNITTEQSTNVNARDFSGAKPDDMVLAFFGFVNRQKGLEDLLTAMVQLRERGITARLLMIGDRVGASDPTNAIYAQEIDRLITENQLTDVIHWTGYVDDADVRAYLVSADAAVLPYQDGASYRRGTLMAAIHQGCAIITTRPQVPIAEFHHGENMLFVPIGNTQALADMLHQLYDNPKMANQLKSGAMALRQNFDWRKIAIDYANFFKTVIEDSV